ncbi:MAG: hypothetical protein KC503_43180 [Myxococcales bacterium]|nr:hypothetical protein [Myxococcales bacterium]
MSTPDLRRMPLALAVLLVASAACAACSDDGSSRAADSAPPVDSAAADTRAPDSAPADAASDAAAPADQQVPPDGAAPDKGTSNATDFTKAGPKAVNEASGSLAVSGCSLAYTLYTPAVTTTQPLVVLGHGFTRTAANVADVAKHIASFGVRVVTPTYCGADHAKNAQDAVALSQQLAQGSKVIHAGHSAGGLSAVLAAGQDSAAIAVLGLDLTDAADAALKAAPGITVPGLGLVGEPSACNANGNGRTVFKSMPKGELIRVVNGSHCDFEAPSGALCGLLCGGADAARALLSRALAAAFIAWQAGVDASGQQWVTPGGSERARLAQSGVIQSVP